jgi:hypothetical protein
VLAENPQMETDYNPAYELLSDSPQHKARREIEYESARRLKGRADVELAHKARVYEAILDTSYSQAVSRVAADNPNLWKRYLQERRA